MEFETSELDMSQLQNDSLPKITMNMSIHDKMILGTVEVPSYPNFVICFNGYKTSVMSAVLPLPPPLYFNLADMMIRFYYAGHISSDEIDFDPVTNKSTIKNTEGEENANHGIDRSERKQAEEIFGHFISTA